MYALFDVDGVINPYAAPPNRRPDGFLTKYVGAQNGEVWDEKPRKQNLALTNTTVVRLWYNPDMGKEILKFVAETGATPVWCTYWERLANKVISPLLGLPEFPTILFPRTASTDSYVHSKCAVIADWVNGEDFVWFDDETKKGDEDFFKEHHSGKALVLKPNPAKGLTVDHLDEARDWIKRR